MGLQVIVGIGVDTVDIDRFGKQLERTGALAARLFTERERTLPIRSLAARFAAKEALIKAVGDSVGLDWHDMEVLASNGSRPVFVRTPALEQVLISIGAAHPHLSISHDGGHAVAMVVLDGPGPERVS